MHVVPVLLPEAGRIHVEEFERPHPLGALPEVELGNDQAAGAAVVGFQVPAVVLQRQQRVVIHQLLEGEVGGVIRVGVDHDRDRLRLDAHVLQQLSDVNPLPAIVQQGPVRDAVDIRGDLHPRELQEFLPGPGGLLLHQAETAEGPLPKINARGRPVGQHRPLLGQALARWNSMRQVPLTLRHSRPLSTRTARTPESPCPLQESYTAKPEASVTSGCSLDPRGDPPFQTPNKGLAIPH